MLSTNPAWSGHYSCAPLLRAPTDSEGFRFLLGTEWGWKDKVRSFVLRRLDTYRTGLYVYEEDALVCSFDARTLPLAATDTHVVFPRETAGVNIIELEDPSAVRFVRTPSPPQGAHFEYDEMDGDTVLVACVGEVCRYRPRSGIEEQRVRIRGVANSFCHVYANEQLRLLAYVGAPTPSRLVALDAVSLEVRWERTLAERSGFLLRSGVLCTEQLIVVEQRSVSEALALEAYRIDDGSLVWRKEKLGLRCAIAYKDLLLVAWADGMLALSLEDGSERFFLALNGTVNDAVMARDVLYASVGTQQLCAVAMDREESLWSLRGVPRCSLLPHESGLTLIAGTNPKQAFTPGLDAAFRRTSKTTKLFQENSALCVLPPEQFERALFRPARPRWKEALEVIDACETLEEAWEALVTQEFLPQDWHEDPKRTFAGETNYRPNERSLMACIASDGPAIVRAEALAWEHLFRCARVLHITLPERLEWSPPELFEVRSIDFSFADQWIQTVQFTLGPEVFSSVSSWWNGELRRAGRRDSSFFFSCTLWKVLCSMNCTLLDPRAADYAQPFASLPDPFEPLHELYALGYGMRVFEDSHDKIELLLPL